jgi:ABC-2 type transport system ATP-binding protein
MDDVEFTNHGIVCSQLSKKYHNSVAISSLTMEVKEGDIFGFLGPNGAGKTTTIRMLCGLINPSSGKGTIRGLDIMKDSTKIRNQIGLMPESSGFYNWMNAEEYLNYFARLYNIDSSIGKRRSKNLLEIVGLANKSSAPIGYYSRGMKQRLGIARALINDPKIVFLDEPTLGLDPRGQKDIQKLLLELNQDKGVTIFLCSHDLRDVAVMCNNIAIIRKGILIAQGSIQELRKLVGDSEQIVITIVNQMEAVEKLSQMNFTFDINPRKDNKLIDLFHIEDTKNNISDIIDTINKAGLKLYEVRRFSTTLTDIFFRLTMSNDKKNESSGISDNDNLEKTRRVRGNT